MATYLQRERRRRIAFWIAVVVLTGAAAAVSYRLTGPPPPKRVRLATGEQGGAYVRFGRQYAAMLAEQGLEVELVETSGGVDNFRRLRDGRVDVAFVQSGTYDRVEDPDRVVRGIAALGLEPLWVIYRSGESLISRLVPYWAMHWVVRAQFLILPLLTLWIPFFKILPLLYRYRIGTLLKKHYAALRDVETGIERADSPSELRSAIQALETLRDDMERLSRKIPAYYQQDVYHWRLHVSMVQDEARNRLEEGGPA